MSDEYSDESGHQASANEIIRIIERVTERVDLNNPPQDPRSFDWNVPSHRRWVRQKFQENADDGEVDEAIIAGFGPDGLGGNAKDDCGKPHPFGCPNCGNIAEFGRTCAMSVCQRCGVAWVRDTGINKSSKMRRFRKEKEEHSPGWDDDEKAEWQKTHHEVISPPLSWFYILACAGYTMQEAQEKTKEIVKAILEEQRAQGVLIRHSFRGKNEDGSIQRESVTDDLGFWKDCINSDRDWHGDVRGELAWKPHYHAIVVCDYLKVADDDDDGPALSEAVEDATGWVLHRIVDENGKSLPNDSAMARAMTYSLSHADIQVRENSHNRSAVWEVGSFYGDLEERGGPVKSTPQFKPKKHDESWADTVVRQAASTVLGLQSGTSECGAKFPGVDDPDELARRVMEDLWPESDRPEGAEVDEDTVLHHIDQGNIKVDVQTTAGGGGNVTVTEAWGQSLSGAGGWGSTRIELPSKPAINMRGDGAVATTPIVDDNDQDVANVECDDEDCDHDHDDKDDGDHHDDVDDDAERCDGQMVPLEELRDRGLLDDPEWCKNAPHVDQLRRADREWPQDLKPYQTEHPGKALGAG